MNCCGDKYVDIYCVNNKQKKCYPLGTSLLEVYKDLHLQTKYNVIVAKVNNVTQDLNYRLYKPKTIDFICNDVPSGMRAYVRSLIFILCNAIRATLPNVRLRIEHPISMGYYCKLEGYDKEISQEVIDKLKKAMYEIIKKDLPFNLNIVTTEEACRILKEEGASETAMLLESNGSFNTKIYEMGGWHNWFLGPIAPSTSYVDIFDIKPFHDGLFLQIPNRKNPVELEPYVQQDKLFSTFSETAKWNDIFGLGNVGGMNEIVHDKEYMSGLIKVAEALQEKKIIAIADQITQRKNTRIILISGPSSSGKTTFSKRLGVQLSVNGYSPVTLSMDDYFHPRTKTPRDANGEYDFESIYSVDLDLFNEQMNALLKGEEVSLPYYNFERGDREYHGNKLRLKKNGLLVIEGIHALNPMLTQHIPSDSIFRVYVSALTTVSFDNHNWIPTRDNRLLRRIVRDYNYRGYSAADTIRSWSKVMAGEEKWIFPYQENADVVFNSALLFEICVLKKFAEPILSEVHENSAEYQEVNRLMNFLKYFSIVPEVELPLTSLLREFLGGSSFKY